MFSRGKVIFLGFAAIAIGLAVFDYVTAAEQVPIHYDITGSPDRVGDPAVLLQAHLLVVALGTLLFLPLGWLIRVLPDALINLPHKNHWLSPLHREETATRFGAWGCTFGTGVIVFDIALQLMTRNDRGLAPVTGLGALSVGFLVFALGSCLWLYRSFRLPRGKQAPN